MAYRQRGEGSFTHLVPQDCRTCKKSKNCKLKNQAGSHCSMRDRVERWVYQYYVRDIANKPVRKSISAKTRKLLLDKVNNLKEKPQETVGTLGAWADVWLEKVIKGSVKTSTYAYYKYMLKYVPEDVRQKPLKSLTLELFADLFQKLYATGSLKDGSALSTTTVRGVRNTLKSCLEVAVKQNLIPFNPVRETRPLRSITKDIVALSKEEAKRLQSVADNVLYRTNSRRKDKGEAYLVRQWAVLIRLLLATGVRRSEAFGLQWENVDFQNRNIRICKSLYKGTLSDVKTSYSVRTINVDVKTMNRLRVWYHEQSAYASLLGDKFTNDYGLVFTGVFGNPVDVDNFRSRVFSLMVKAARLPEGTTLHSLRHTHATLMLHAGVDAKTVSKRLGHSSVAFTLQVYVSHTDAVDTQAASVISGLLDD